VSRRLVVPRAIAVLALLVAGCSLLPGIQQDEAIEIAVRATRVSEPVVIDVREGMLGKLRGEPNPGTDNRLVWAVTLRGGLEVCGPPDPSGGAQCLDLEGESTVYLDHETGENLGVSTHGPVLP
jgi:hypothetical protein